MHMGQEDRRTVAAKGFSECEAVRPLVSAATGNSSAAAAAATRPPLAVRVAEDSSASSLRRPLSGYVVPAPQVKPSQLSSHTQTRLSILSDQPFEKRTLPFSYTLYLYLDDLSSIQNALLKLLSIIQPFSIGSIKTYFISSEEHLHGLIITFH